MPLSLSPGLLLRDRYRLVSILGAGAHGVTILAHHELLDHPCVVKVLPFAVEHAEQAPSRRLRHEASAGFRVNHPNVVRVIDCDVFDQVWYMVTEFVDGADLATLQASHGRFPWKQVVRIAIDVANGLEAIHRASLVHRDIKPSNILLGVDGRCRIADLGVVAFSQSHGGTTRVKNPGWAGTLTYASPEVLRGAAEVGPAADLYSLGASLFELLSGTPPHKPGLFTALLSRESRAESPAAALKDAPVWLAGAISRLLDPDPPGRFGSAHELAEFLTRHIDAAPQPARKRTAEPAEPRGIVVIPFDSRAGDGADDWLGHALADHLARALARHPRIPVVDRDQFAATLERIRGRANVSPHKTRMDAARLSGAATVIEGDFERRGDEVEIAASLHRGSEQPPAVERVCGPISGLAALEDLLRRRIEAALHLTQRPEPEQPRRTPTFEAEERLISAKRFFMRGNYEKARELADAALELDPEYGEAIGLIGVACARMGRYPEALEHNAAQQALAARSGDARLLVESLANLGTLHYFRGDYANACEHLQRAAETADRCGRESDVALIRNNLGFVLLQLGRTREAEEMFRSAIDVHCRNGARLALIGPYSGLGNVLREQRRYDEARAHFRLTLALAQEGDDFVNLGVAYLNLGQCALLQERFVNAKNELMIALNILEQTSFLNGLARVYEQMAELNLRLQNASEALRCAERRLELADREGSEKMRDAACKQRDEARRLVSRAATEPGLLGRARALAVATGS